MEHSNDYLDKMLNFAITRYNKPPIENLNTIPDYLDSVENAISTFKNVLEYEAYHSLQKKENNIDNPILYSVNLDTDEPGIIIGEDKNSKLLVHTKQKLNDNDKSVDTDKIIKKSKNMDTIEKEATRAMTKIMDKQKKDEYEVDMKKKNKRIKETDTKTNRLNKIDTIHNKLQDEISKIDMKPTKTQVHYEKMNKKQSEMDKLKDEVGILNSQIANNLKTLEQDKLDVEDYNAKKLEKKLAKPKKEPKPKKDKNEDNEKEKKPKTKQLENKHIILCDEENDIITDFHNMNKEEQNIDYNTKTDTKQMDKNKVSYFASPIPLERHINALYKCDPHPALLPTLLYGKNVNDSHEIIKIFHGPPGTGKTYRLIYELDKLLNSTTSGKILICAPSNIGVINLYEKAIKFQIYGRIILGQSYQKYLPDLNIDEKEKINTRVYFSTVSMRDGKLLKNTEFQTIFLDEAAQCPEALVWGLLRKSVNKLYMAGDPLQLPALVSEKGQELEYGRSLMERLMKLNIPVELLNTQRRMNPIIAQFSNQTFYDNKISSDYNGSSKGLEPLKIINIEGQEELNGTSYYNQLEGEKTLEVVNDMKSVFDNIVIIAPYKAQCSFLKNNLKKYNLTENDVEIHTLDSFQGKEADVIILSTVRSGDNIGFWNDYRRLNVGLTRAKHILRIVGNTKTWKKTNGPLKEFYQFYKTIKNSLPS